MGASDAVNASSARHTPCHQLVVLRRRPVGRRGEHGRPGPARLVGTARFGATPVESRARELFISTIRRAARRASMLESGSESEIANQAYSCGRRPLNIAFRGDPVCISPGSTVVTTMLSGASSALRPSERPASANLLAE